MELLFCVVETMLSLMDVVLSFVQIKLRNIFALGFEVMKFLLRVLKTLLGLFDVFRSLHQTVVGMVVVVMVVMTVMMTVMTVMRMDIMMLLFIVEFKPSPFQAASISGRDLTGAGRSGRGSKSRRDSSGGKESSNNSTSINHCESKKSCFK